MEEERGPNCIPLPAEVACDPTCSLNDLVASVFDEMPKYAKMALSKDAAASVSEEKLSVVADRYFASRAILSPKNESVDEINALLLERLSAEGECISYSADSVDLDRGDNANYPQEFLNSLNPSGCAPHCLKLRKGMVLMLVRNIDRERGLCNGTRCVLIECTRKVLDVRVLTGKAAGQRTYIPRITVSTETRALPCQLRRRQFPTKPA